MKSTTKKAAGVGLIALGSSVMAIPTAPVGWEWVKTVASVIVNCATAVMAFYNTAASGTNKEGKKHEGIPG